MKYRFSIDDNIRFLQDIAEHHYASIFDNEFLQFLKQVHDTYETKIQLNLFYSGNGFNLSLMPDCYKDEWKANSDWLKLSFHSYSEFPDAPYKTASKEQLYNDCTLIHNEIKRFAGEDSLSYFTTIHFAQATKDGLKGLKECEIKGLIGLFGEQNKPQLSYHLSYDISRYIHNHLYYTDNDLGIRFFNNDIVLNCHSKEDIVPSLQNKIGNEFIELMIHEQYFYSDYPRYQADFKEKITTAIAFLSENGYTPAFLEEIE